VVLCAHNGQSTFRGIATAVVVQPVIADFNSSRIHFELIVVTIAVVYRIAGGDIALENGGRWLTVAVIVCVHVKLRIGRWVHVRIGIIRQAVAVVVNETVAYFHGARINQGIVIITVSACERRQLRKGLLAALEFGTISPVSILVRVHVPNALGVDQGIRVVAVPRGCRPSSRGHAGLKGGA
jgi:hypothetical protein